MPQSKTLPSDAAIVALLRAGLPGLQAVYRYGSAGGIYERPESDVDVAVLADVPLDFSIQCRLAAEIARLVGRDVDLNDLRRLPVTLRVQIVTGGRRLFAANPAATEEYDSRVLSDYAYLNESRKAILDDVRARGSIYG
ncbi:MAG: nucleotidyltransferase domain-containing protein [Rhodocyclaceae bacterium]|nr:nucleotidyltransferase domain-containing protein [Rhodocyclaceae bacterium]